MLLGAHMSISGGVDKAILRGHEVACETIQIFTRSPRQWRARVLEDEEIARFRRVQEETGIDPVIAHDCYLINLASPEDELWQKSLVVFVEELGHCRNLGIPYLVLHPGSHVGSGVDAGLERVAAALDRARGEIDGSGVKVLLENTAGQGTNLGSTFEQLSALLNAVTDDSWLGVCFDTCHAFAAGYDLRTKRSYAKTFRDFDRILGLERLRAFHLNDSLKDLGSKVDRHTHIGAGKLGLKAFSLLVNDPAFRDRPMVLETPKGPDLKEDIENLKLLRSLRKARPKRRGARNSSKP